MNNSTAPEENFNPVAPAPVFRFIVELTTWVWLLILGLMTFNINILTVDISTRTGIEPWFFLFLLGISLLLLSQFNVLGDKKPHGRLVPGWLRIIIEISSASLGIFAAWILFGLTGGLLQACLVLFAFFLDRERWKWFLGLRSDPPSFVKVLGYYKG
ncbi:MAG: hypothetical protein ACFFD4_34270 [Candidatus Odinarchaeota archaeon]